MRSRYIREPGRLFEHRVEFRDGVSRDQRHIMRAWCEAEIGPRLPLDRKSWTWADGIDCFFFVSADAALAFKMRWV